MSRHNARAIALANSTHRFRLLIDGRKNQLLLTAHKSQKKELVSPMLRTLLLSAMSAACLLSAVPQPNSLKHPLVFEPNLGQFPRHVKWIARGPGYRLILTSEGATFKLLQGISETEASGHSLRKPSYSTVKMKLAGSRPWTSIRGLEPTGGVTNYLFGNNPREWRTGIQQYTRVSIGSVYPGIDLRPARGRGRCRASSRSRPPSRG